jgi:cell division cycle 14
MIANITAEIIPNRLYWISDRIPPSKKPNTFYFCTDYVIYKQQYIYRPYSSDFGPLDLGKVFRYIIELNSILKDPKHQKSIIYHYASNQPSKKANSALLIGCYQILVLRKTADEACQAFEQLEAFTPFVDASFQPSNDTFDLKSYENMSSIENGGLNWIIPNKLLAFVCPANERTSKYPALTPELYTSLFKTLGITDVIRLNNKTYEAERFGRYGFNHTELYFLDGSIPNEIIVSRFIDLVDKAQGGVAVHCKAGLGRTATLIGCYAMKNFGFTGLEFIGWARLCRPGSVLGPQQQFLCNRDDVVNGRVPKGLISDEEKFKGKFGDYGQSKRLIAKTGTMNTSESSRDFYKKGLVKVGKTASMKSILYRKK